MTTNTNLAPKPTSFLAAMIHFFGKKEGQNALQFGEEVKAAIAVPGAREYFIAGLAQNGYSIAEPAKA